MRKVVLQLAVSLDGFIEGPNGEYDWCFTDQDYGMTDFFDRVDALFIGRKSYELVQKMDEQDGSGLPKLKEYVFSKTLTKVKAGATLVHENIKAEVEKIKNAEGKDIWFFGGANLTESFLSLCLIDELSLAIHPILLGSGKRLFPKLPDRIKLEQISSKSYSSGLSLLTYLIKY